MIKEKGLCAGQALHPVDVSTVPDDTNYLIVPGHFQEIFALHTSIIVQEQLSR